MLKLLNYAVRGITIVLGVLMASGMFTPDTQDESLPRILGIVLALFGTYRLLLYHFRQQRKSDDEE